MLFVIVYTGEHYIVDVLAGAILAILCYFAAHKITRMKSRVEEKEGISGIEYKNALGKMAKTVIGGIIILFIGVAIGSYNRNQFLNHPVAYNLYMPKYVDFIKHEEEFLSSYQVQLYLGSHSLFRGEFQKAIPYYERALSLSKNEQERERAEAGLSKCKELLERKS
jgi:predicted PurR-regulated permease PerM